MTTDTDLVSQAAERFPGVEAGAFMALVQALGRNAVDATLLCLLVERQAAFPEMPVTASYRSLAANSQGAFVMQAVQKSLQRLAQQSCITRLERGLRACEFSEPCIWYNWDFFGPLLLTP